MIFEKIKLYPEREDVTLTAYILMIPSRCRKEGDARLSSYVRAVPVTCSDREGEPFAMAFASMGYHAFVLRYSVSGLAVYPSQMRDRHVNSENERKSGRMEAGSGKDHSLRIFCRRS